MDLKLEVVMVPVSDLHQAKGFISSRGGRSRTPTSPVTATSGSCSRSRIRARRARSSRELARFGR